MKRIKQLKYVKDGVDHTPLLLKTLLERRDKKAQKSMKGPWKVLTVSLGYPRAKAKRILNYDPPVGT